MIPQLPAIQAADSQNFVDIRNNHTLLRYFQNIEQQFMYANNFGVAIDDNDSAENGAKAVFLRDLLVRPNLSKYHVTPEQMFSGDAVAELGMADLLAEHQRLFVLGDPGTGKTTLINSLMLAFSYYGDNLTKLALGKRVPFPLILRELPFYLYGTAITDLKPLSRLVQLQILVLMLCPITDIKPLAKLKHLSQLDIDSTSVSDLSPLAELTGLTHLDLRRTPINDLSPLAQLHNLEILILDNTAVTDLSPLMRLESLWKLSIRNTAANPEVLSHLPNLKIVR